MTAEVPVPVVPVKNPYMIVQSIQLSMDMGKLLLIWITNQSIQ